MRYFIELEDREWIAESQSRADDTTTFELKEVEGAGADTTASQRHDVRLLSSSALLVDGKVIRVVGRQQVRPGVLKLDLELAGQAPRSVLVETERARALAFEAGSAEFAAHEVKSPMPGRVLKLLVAEGQEVERGTALLVVEAMKMENQINAERSGSIERLAVKVGDAVEAGQLLLTWQ